MSSLLVSAIRKSPQSPLKSSNEPSSTLPIVDGVTVLDEHPSGSGGPDGVWKLYKAKSTLNDEPVSLVVCQKRTIDKTGRGKRREAVVDLLRTEVQQLTCSRHSRFVNVVKSVDETSDYLAFVSEPLEYSLADLMRSGKHTELTELEVVFGVYQLTDALRFLHSTLELMHCNLNPGCIYITNQRLWKLGGLAFVEKIADHNKTTLPFTGFSPKQPKQSQPCLDYIAPEAQLDSVMTTLADMFSLGMVICALYNNGQSLIDAQNNTANYAKKVDQLSTSFDQIVDKMPKVLVEPVRKLISREVRDRPTSQLFALLKIFNEPTVLSYEGLILLESRSLNQKKEFFVRFTKVVSNFDSVMRYERVQPHLERWLAESDELVPFLLPSWLTLVQMADQSDFEKRLQPTFNRLLTSSRTIQTSIVLVDMLGHYVMRLSQQDLIDLILPDIYACLEAATSQSLKAVKNAVGIITHYLTEDQLVSTLVNRFTTDFYATKTSSVRLRCCCLDCISALLASLSMSTTIQNILPFIGQLKVTEIGFVDAVLHIIGHLLSARKCDLNCGQISQFLMPPALSIVSLNGLSLSNFRLLMDLIRLMLDRIDRMRTCELIMIEHKSQSGSCSNINSTSSNLGRPLPLIAMQRPTMDVTGGGSTQSGRMSMDATASASSDNRLPKLTSTAEYRRCSGGEVSNEHRWTSQGYRLQRLLGSRNRSEGVLYGLRQPGGLNLMDRHYWRDSISTPGSGSSRLLLTGQATAHSSGSRIGGSSLTCNSFTSMIERRHSGNLPESSQHGNHQLTSSTNYNDCLNSLLNVPRSGGGIGHLDPRRHSYGSSSATASVSSLLTVNVCEGPFTTPSSARLSLQRSAGHVGYCSPGNNEADDETGINRRSSLNVISDLLRYLHRHAPVRSPNRVFENK